MSGKTTYVQPQITLQAGEKIYNVLKDEDSTFDDIVVAMTGCTAMTFASTAEALFAPTQEAEGNTYRTLADKIKKNGLRN